jgi:hypothetical protein
VLTDVVSPADAPAQRSDNYQAEELRPNAGKVFDDGHVHRRQRQPFAL